MHNRNGQSVFQTFGAKNEIVSITYSVLGTLLENSLCFLRLYGKVLLILNFPHNCRRRAMNMFICFYHKCRYFCAALRKKRLHLGFPEMLIYNQNKQLLVSFHVHCWFYCLGVWDETSRLKDSNQTEIIQTFSWQVSVYSAICSS